MNIVVSEDGVSPRLGVADAAVARARRASRCGYEYPHGRAAVLAVKIPVSTVSYRITVIT